MAASSALAPAPSMPTSSTNRSSPSSEATSRPDRGLSGLATPSRVSLLTILFGAALGCVLWIIGKAMA